MKSYTCRISSGALRRWRGISRSWGPEKRSLRENTPRAKRFIDNRDQILSRDRRLLPLGLDGIDIFGDQRPARFHARVRFHAIALPRIKQLRDLMTGQNPGAAQKLRHQRDSSEVLHGLHLEERLV